MNKRKAMLKITISTKNEYLSPIKHGILKFVGDQKYNLEYSISIRDIDNRVSEDPLVEVLIGGAVSGIVGAAVKSFFDWLRESRRQERGFGHVRYKTLGIARSEARYDLEKIHNIHSYEGIEAQSQGWNFSIVFRDNNDKIHYYSISPSCSLRSYFKS